MGASKCEKSSQRRSPPSGRRAPSPQPSGPSPALRLLSAVAAWPSVPPTASCRAGEGGGPQQDCRCRLETAPPACCRRHAAKVSELGALRLDLLEDAGAAAEASGGVGGITASARLLPHTRSTGPASRLRARTHSSPGDSTQPIPSSSSSEASCPEAAAPARAVITSPTSLVSPPSGQYSPLSATSNICVAGCCRLNLTRRAAASSVGARGGSTITHFFRAKSSVRMPSRWLWLKNAAASKSTLSKRASIVDTSSHSFSFNLAASGSSRRAAIREGTGSQRATTR
mmetsp:Transcript_103559/g.322682  ORF Transcript_103559/g.322682 Transcript_103559/m.322682 type:complete len:285 (+) Transcript_103559:259-1113(+)